MSEQIGFRLFIKEEGFIGGPGEPGDPELGIDTAPVDGELFGHRSALLVGIDCPGALGWIGFEAMKETYGDELHPDYPLVTARAGEELLILCRWNGQWCVRPATDDEDGTAHWRPGTRNAMGSQQLLSPVLGSLFCPDGEWMVLDVRWD